jgi:hypothetical protein
MMMDKMIIIIWEINIRDLLNEDILNRYSIEGLFVLLIIPLIIYLISITYIITSINCNHNL